MKKLKREIPKEKLKKSSLDKPEITDNIFEYFVKITKSSSKYNRRDLIYFTNPVKKYLI